jgi:DNA-binding NarL/FixJ family response regulator
LNKAASPNEIFSAVRAVAAGEVVMGASTAASLVSTSDDLTEEEVTLLRLFVAGHGQTEMARGLLVSESTLKRKFLEVQRKLGVANRVQAVARAAREGWI